METKTARLNVLEHQMERLVRIAARTPLTRVQFTRLFALSIQISREHALLTQAPEPRPKPGGPLFDPKKVDRAVGPAIVGERKGEEVVCSSGMLGIKGIVQEAAAAAEALRLSLEKIILVKKKAFRHQVLPRYQRNMRRLDFKSMIRGTLSDAQLCKPAYAKKRVIKGKKEGGV